MIRGAAIKALNGEKGPLADEAIIKLYEALDSYIPLPERAVDKPFLMPIEDVFSISGRGTVVTGRIERGRIKVGEEAEIVGLKDTQKTVVTGVEMFRKLLDAGEAGDNVGCLLRGIDKEAVERGQVLAKPGSVKPHKKFKAEAYILTKEEGGRHTPFFANYRPQFYFRTTDVTGVVTLPEGTEMVMPGDNAEISVELITPIAMEEKVRFAIREGGRTVGAGVVTKIIVELAAGAAPTMGSSRRRRRRKITLTLPPWCDAGAPASPASPAQHQRHTSIATSAWRDAPGDVLADRAWSGGLYGWPRAARRFDTAVSRKSARRQRD